MKVSTDLQPPGLTGDAGVYPALCEYTYEMSLYYTS